MALTCLVLLGNLVQYLCIAAPMSSLLFICPVQVPEERVTITVKNRRMRGILILPLEK